MDNNYHKGKGIKLNVQQKDFPLECDVSGVCDSIKSTIVVGSLLQVHYCVAVEFEH